MRILAAPSAFVLTGASHLLGNMAGAKMKRRSRFSRVPKLNRSRSSGAKAGEQMTQFCARAPIRGLRHVVAGAVLVCFSAAFGALAQAQGAVKSKYGDWEIRCDNPAGSSAEQCALIQSVVAEDKANVSLVVIVLKTSDRKSRLLRVIAPLGVLLPNGLGLKIDETDIGRAGFVKCLPTGCIAEVVMEDKLIEQLKSGKTATFIIHQTPDEGIGLPLTLAGFKDGFSHLP